MQLKKYSTCDEARYDRTIFAVASWNENLLISCLFFTTCLLVTLDSIVLTQIYINNTKMLMSSNSTRNTKGKQIKIHSFCSCWLKQRENRLTPPPRGFSELIGGAGWIPLSAWASADRSDHFGFSWAPGSWFQRPRARFSHPRTLA